MPDKVVGDNGSRNARIRHGAVFRKAGSDKRKLDGVKHDVICFNVVKAVPVVAAAQNPGLLVCSQILGGHFQEIMHATLERNLLWLPHAEKPVALGGHFPFHKANLAANANRLGNGIAQQHLAIVVHHLGCHIERCYHAVLRRGGAVHHVGFVQFIAVDPYMRAVFDVQHGGLRKGREQLVG